MESQDIPQNFIDDLYCYLGFLPLPGQIWYLYQIELKVDDYIKRGYYYYDELKRRDRYLKRLYYDNKVNGLQEGYSS